MRQARRTSDGYALATGWQRGWSLWSVYGRLLCWGVGDNEGEVSATFEDGFMNGVKGFVRAFVLFYVVCEQTSAQFWGPGDLELFLLCPAGSAPKGKGARQAVYFDGPDAEDCTAIDQQLYSLPLARSAVTGIHSPVRSLLIVCDSDSSMTAQDNTNQAFLQLDDRVLVYRGADQPDMSVINPESDVWQNIKVSSVYPASMQRSDDVSQIPAEYLHANWPIRLACISSDARLIAIAGRRGLTHYNSLSGRWKLFEDEGQEQSFRVEGGMQWYAGYLVASAIENGRSSVRSAHFRKSVLWSDARKDSHLRSRYESQLGGDPLRAKIRLARRLAVHL